METTIYRNYGLLAHEYETIYSVAESEICDEILVEIPEDVFYGRNECDQIIVTLDGTLYLLCDVLGAKGDAPALKWFDGKRTRTMPLKWRSAINRGTNYSDLFRAAQELAAHVTFAGVLFAACTARASVEPETRQRGVFVHLMDDEFSNGDCVLFNDARLPESEEEARTLLEESAAADSSQECLQSIEWAK